MLRALSILSATVLAFAPATSARAADDAKAVITKAVKAHGGEDVTTKYKATQASSKGKIDIPGVGEVEFTQQLSSMMPDKFKDEMEINVAGQKISIVTIANGDQVSIEAGGNKIEVTDAIKDSLKDARHMMKVARLVPLLKEKGFELSLVGEVKVDGKDAVGVRVVTKGEKDINLYFDKKTDLLVKMERRTVEPNGGAEITEERIILEYKKNADGVPLPKKILLNHDGKKFLEAEILESQLLEKLDDSVFKK